MARGDVRHASGEALLPSEKHPSGRHSRAREKPLRGDVNEH